MGVDEAMEILWTLAKAQQAADTGADDSTKAARTEAFSVMKAFATASISGTINLPE